jgi:hypothetical protein
VQETNGLVGHLPAAFQRYKRVSEICKPDDEGAEIGTLRCVMIDILDAVLRHTCRNLELGLCQEPTRDQVLCFRVLISCLFVVLLTVLCDHLIQPNVFLQREDPRSPLPTPCIPPLPSCEHILTQI